MKRLPFRFWAALAVLVIVFGGLFYLIMNAPPEGNVRTVSWIRESPAWQFYGVMGLCSIPFLLFLYIMANQKRWSRMATQGSIRNAKKVALSLWRVDGTLEDLEAGVRELEDKVRALGFRVRNRRMKHPLDYLGPKEDSFVVIKFQHMSWGRWMFILPVRPGHPDIEQFRQLKKGDTVEFEPLSEGMECALEHELCGYLRIKSVS